jgi:FixJ family two-component response regulator
VSFAPPQPTMASQSAKGLGSWIGHRGGAGRCLLSGVTQTSHCNGVRTVFDPTTDHAGCRSLIATLTPREREVFELVVRGQTNKHAARSLGCAERTIKAHRQRVMEKMQVRRNLFPLPSGSVFLRSAMSDPPELHSHNGTSRVRLSWQQSCRQSEMSCMQNRNLVLVVDDDASMLQSVARLLRQLGYASLLFSSAEAFANHDDFDRAICILLDINLGDGSGIELRHRLKAAGNPVPVIYMTGNDTPAVREAALQSGCLAYLTKPFTAKSLIEPLKKASAQRS